VVANPYAQLTDFTDVELPDIADPVWARNIPAEEQQPQAHASNADLSQTQSVTPPSVPNNANEADDQHLALAPDAQEDHAAQRLLAPSPGATDQEDNEERVGDATKESQPSDNEDALHYAVVGLLAFIIGLMLVTLQGLGLYYSATGIHTKDITVNWCSPAFRDFAVAITTGNCQKYEVIDSSSNGIGCISLPGSQQRDWLRGTIIALSAALFCEVADTVLMMCTTSETNWREVKAQRPWLTMFFGVIMLVILIVKGWGNAGSLPRGLTEAVWVYRKEASRTMGRVCKGKLNAPGLRGMMIGYMDGLFQNWGSVYDGR
jgi:hypothetical protein